MVSVHVYDQKEYDIWFAGLPYLQKGNQQGKTLKSWCKEEGADAVYNHTWFAMPTLDNIRKGISYHTVCYTRAKGSDIGYGGIPQRIILDANNQTGGCYLGIMNGVVMNPSKTGSTVRNYEGLTKDGRYIQAQTGNLTQYDAIQQIIRAVRKYNTDVDILLEQDGGGSVGYYNKYTDILTAPRKEGLNGRPVSSVVCIKKKKDISLGGTLMLGMMGSDVRRLQIALGGLDCDGIYGSATRGGVIAVQKKLGLVADGIAGPITQKALGFK